MNDVSDKCAALIKKNDELIRILDLINFKIHVLNRKLDDLYKISPDMALAEEDKQEEYRRSLYKLTRNIHSDLNAVQNELFWVSSPIKTNGVIELRKTVNGRRDDLQYVEGEYSICLADQREVIGSISYRGYHYSEYLADIAYHIYSEYRGHNYSYYALCLLGELLKEKGIHDVWISAYDDNIASSKVIVKYGGVPIINGEGYTLYQADTFIIDKEKSEQMNK